MKMVEVLPNVDVSYLDKVLLDVNGHVKPMPSHLYKAIPLAHLKVWMHAHGRYSLPSTELLEFLEKEIGDQQNNCIEIAAGAGDLGFYLGIKMTDSYVQLRDKNINISFAMMKQPIVPYSKDVEEIDALSAVDKYKPKIVIASWATQFSDNEMEPGFPYGINEELLLQKVDKYILIGSMHVHGDKRICKLKHKVIQADWLVGRGTKDNGNFNRIWIWDTKCLS